MALKCMSAGDGETSYANNSGLQKVLISKTWCVLDETLRDMFMNPGFPKCMKMADFGCASGPNTLLVISHIMDTIKDLSKLNNVNRLPDFEVFLSDLSHNDFNNLFKLLPGFWQDIHGNDIKSECFIYGAPGSFYGRLFPSRSLHLAYSSCCLHWLSQIPPGVGMNNKENIHMAATSPPEIFEAFAKQFQRDFSRFLSFRGEEITPGGRMVFLLLCRSAADPSSKEEFALFTLLAETLSDLVAQGLVKEKDLYSFNVPIYPPCLQEVEAIINNEGSFMLDGMEVVHVPWDANDYNYDNIVFDKHMSGVLVSNCVRAFMEPMLARHFGSSIIDGVFDIYAEKMAEHLSVERSSYFAPVISLTRKSGLM